MDIRVSFEETGLYYLQSRYYDPEVGRFISQDEVTYLDPETINGLNLYAYCGNNPVMYIDPNGKFIISFLAGLGIAAVTFAVVNTVTQFVGDVINYVATGVWNSGWEDYVGAFLGGLAGGSVFFLTHGNLVLTFAVMGGIETLSTSLLTNATGRTNYSSLEIFGRTLLSVGIGIITGYFGGTKIKGITLGRNSFISIWKSGLTRLRNNTGHMLIKTIIKGFISIALLRSAAGLINGIFRSITHWIQRFLGNEKSIGDL